MLGVVAAAKITFVLLQVSVEQTKNKHLSVPRIKQGRVRLFFENLIEKRSFFCRIQGLIGPLLHILGCT
jgi:hypothetical protein